MVDINSDKLPEKIVIKEKINSGISRVVYLTNMNSVLKIAKSKRGRRKNKIEHLISSNNPKLPIAKVQHISNDYEYLIMDYIVGTKPTNNEISKLQSYILQETNWYISDLNSEGVLKTNNNEIIAIDYGSAKRQNVDNMSKQERKIYGLKEKY